MRILLVHHFPLQQSAPGQLARQWALALNAAGHEARLLIVDSDLIDPNSGQRDEISIARIVCRKDDPRADLPFDVPYFERCAAAGQATFGGLSDSQLAAYRDRLRRHLDREIDSFDPHLIHAQHVWVLGQLALETGVPYVLNAWGPELIDYASDPRYRALADQAAENAGRILVPDEGILRQVVDTFESAAERTLLLTHELDLREPSPSVTARAAACDGLLALYQAVLDERFGRDA